MLEVQNEEHLAAVRAFAESRGLSEKLQEKLDYLDTYAEGDDRGRTRCMLFAEAPYSFYFVMECRRPDGTYAMWFNGGLIYFGEGDTGVGAPQFSVRIGTTEEGWEVHT
jgi:hypothetical protein